MLRTIRLVAIFLLACAGGAEAASLTVAWDPSAGATGYVVLYGTQSGSYPNQVNVGNVTQYTISNLAAGARYYVVVRASNTAGTSQNSSEVSGVTPSTTPPGGTNNTDFSGDGYPDLLWQHTSGSLIAWYMQGVNLSSWDYLTPSTTGDPLLKLVGSGDFDGDGQQDLVFRHDSTGDVSVWMMQGRIRRTVGTLNPAGTTMGPGWTVARVGDFNNDGAPDILWRNSSTGQLVVWNMQGLNRLSVDTLGLAPDFNWSIAGAADFDGDGRLDMVWRNNSTGHLTLWYMQGATLRSWRYLNPDRVPDTAWKLVGVGDFNSDGHPDLAWRNDASGLMTVWYMNGGDLAGWSYLAPSQTVLPSTGWQTRVVR